MVIIGNFIKMVLYEVYIQFLFYDENNDDQVNCLFFFGIQSYKMLKVRENISIMIGNKIKYI